MPSVRDVGELALIQRVRRSAARAAGEGVRVGIGDDTAVLALSPDAVLLATTDLVVEDIHFRRASATPRDIGWKAIAVNLSDIAAMGGVPRWALIAIALPASTPMEDVDEFYAGLEEAASPHRVVVVGGDTSASPAGWVINVTLLGEHRGQPRLRSMARPGDAIAVTGSVGRSAAGLAVLESGRTSAWNALGPMALDELIQSHLRPRARVSEGMFLASQPGVRAMMDCSDGLATDLGHICRESGVGATVRLDRLPVSAAVRQAGRAAGRDPMAWATGGGEDYELLLTCGRDSADEIAAGLERATGTRLTVIGEVVAGEPRIAWIGALGEPVSIPAGYEHFHG